MKPGLRWTFAITIAAVVCWTLQQWYAANMSQPSVKTMAGQMLMIGFQGTRADQSGPRAAARMVKEGKAGGVILLGMNFGTREEVCSLTQLFRGAAGDGKVLLAVDQEGGLVQRLGPKQGYEAMPSATLTAQTMTPRQARTVFDQMTAMVEDAGFNVNLAPVVDLGINLENKAVGNNQRTYDSGADRVMEYAREFMDSMHARRILPVLKHYPGHGSSAVDSHDDFTDISETWREEELRPFVHLTKVREPVGIMTGHLILRSLAPDGAPVTLSRAAIHETLREKEGFEGLVITDDLQMAAIRKHHTLEEAVILAVNAGADVLMISDQAMPDPSMPDRIIRCMEAAVEDGRIQKNNITAAWNRIMRVKAWLAH